MDKKRKPIDRDERRENVLRPCRYLGYDRDEIAVHLMGREAFSIAESQFRRAVWLNPYEPTFKEHLAWCLFQQHRYAEALPAIDEAISQQPDAPRFKELKRLIETRINENASAAKPSNRPA
jgi:tetratricopeptide (TPR) repeat protein